MIIKRLCTQSCKQCATFGAGGGLCYHARPHEPRRACMLSCNLTSYTIRGTCRECTEEEVLLYDY